MSPRSFLSKATPRHLLPCRRHISTSELHSKLTTRPLNLVYDYLSPQPSHLLNVSLSTFLSSPNDHKSTVLPLASQSAFLPPAHHLIYFPPQIPADKLLADGTDPVQSPGAPWIRRMWAGGRIRFVRDVPLDCSRAVCVEGIRDVVVKGEGESEKIFVGIERRVGIVRDAAEGEEALVKRVWTVQEEDVGDAAVIERRNLVFMRERSEDQNKIVPPRIGERRAVRAPHAPTYTESLLPDPTLLFRYSALTFNAHRIHLDKEYTSTLEGHRNLLVHGPLSLTLMVTVLAQNLPSGVKIKEVEYRNLAPLYVEEEMRVCGAEKKGNGSSDGEWHVWVENGEGSLAVRGSVKTENI